MKLVSWNVNGLRAAMKKGFMDYFNEHKNEIDDLTRKRIFNSAKHIAESVRKINAAEHKYLNRLKKLLKE